MYEMCVRCNTKNSIMEDNINGILVCTSCGWVHEENVVVDEYEKRTFESDNNEIKRVAPPTKPGEENSQGTIMIIKGNGVTKMVKTYTEKTEINKVKKRIEKLLSRDGIPNKIIAETKNLYEKLSEKINMKGKNLNHIIIALYYYVCRKENVAKSYKELAEMFPVTERQIKNVFTKYISKIVDYKEEKDYSQIEKRLIYNYIGGNMTKNAVIELAYKIIDNINNHSLLEGRSSNTVAGLSLLLSSKLLNNNVDESGDFFSTFSSKAVIKKAFAVIKPNLHEIIPNENSNKIEELIKQEL